MHWECDFRALGATSFRQSWKDTQKISMARLLREDDTRITRSVQDLSTNRLFEFSAVDYFFNLSVSSFSIYFYFS